jgi:hypothetical protein
MSETGAVPGPRFPKRYSSEKEALVEMAKLDKARGGISRADLEAYKDLNRTLKDPFSENMVRGPETHPTTKYGSNLHGHVGPVDHIAILD